MFLIILHALQIDVRRVVKNVLYTETIVRNNIQLFYFQYRAIFQKTLSRYNSIERGWLYIDKFCHMCFKNLQKNLFVLAQQCRFL